MMHYRNWLVLFVPQLTRACCVGSGRRLHAVKRLGAEPLSDAGAIDQIETGGFDLDDAAAVDVDAPAGVTRVEEAMAGLSALAAAVREAQVQGCSYRWWGSGHRRQVPL